MNRSLPFQNSHTIFPQFLLESALAPWPPHSSTLDNQVNVYLKIEVHHISHPLCFLTVYQRWFSKHIYNFFLEPCNRMPIHQEEEMHEKHLGALWQMYLKSPFSCFAFLIMIKFSKIWQEFILEQIIKLTEENSFFFSSKHRFTSD